MENHQMADKKSEERKPAQKHDNRPKVTQHSPEEYKKKRARAGRLRGVYGGAPKPVKVEALKEK